jgi:hypothetical protein
MAVNTQQIGLEVVCLEERLDLGGQELAKAPVQRQQAFAG